VIRRVPWLMVSSVDFDVFAGEYCFAVRFALAPSRHARDDLDEEIVRRNLDDFAMSLLPSKTHRHADPRIGPARA